MKLNVLLVFLEGAKSSKTGTSGQLLGVTEASEGARVVGGTVQVLHVRGLEDTTRVDVRSKFCSYF